MIPILYDSNETAFTSNGIGRLVDAIFCTVTEERNGPYELEMQYPVDGRYFEEITHSRIIFADPADGKSPQPFRVYRISKPLDGICTVYAEHISYQLSDIPVMPFTANSCAEALQGLVSHAGQDCPFTVWTDKGVTGKYTTDTPRPFRELLGGASGSILDVYGKGEYEFDRYNVKLYVNRGSDTGVEIRYAKNLVDLVKDEDIGEIYTGVCPYWKNSETGRLVTLPEIAIWADTAGNYPYKRTKIVDFSSEWETAPTVSQLRARTQTYIEANDIGIPKITVTVEFVPLDQMSGVSLRVDDRFELSSEDYPILERINLCDTVTVIYNALGVSVKAKVVKTVYNVLLDRYESIEVGEAKTTLASQIVNLQEDMEEARETSQSQAEEVSAKLKAYVDHQTELITGGLGGYVVLNPNANGEPQEILIMDAPKIETAVNVIRMNKNGIGFSRNGYSGPYFSAWTIDGIFNASAIGAGEMDAVYIKAGTVTADKLAASAVTTDKLAANAVTASKIAAGAVTTDQLSANAVTTDKLKANAVTTDKIAAGAVTTDQLEAGAITADKIAAGAITADKIATRAITIGQLAADVTGAIDEAQTSADAAASLASAANTLAAGKSTVYYSTADPSGSGYKAGDVWVRNVSSGVGGDVMWTYSGAAWVKHEIGTTTIIDGSITTDLLAANAVTAGKISAGAVTTAKLEAGAVTSAKIAAGAITADKIAAGAITAGNIDLYGKMGVYTDSTLGTNGGYIGYMSGSTSSGTTTNGIAIMDGASRNYVMATNAGVKMRNSSASTPGEFNLAGGVGEFVGRSIYIQGDAFLNATSSGGTVTYSGTTTCNALSSKSYVSAQTYVSTPYTRLGNSTYGGDFRLYNSTLQDRAVMSVTGQGAALWLYSAGSAQAFIGPDGYGDMVLTLTNSSGSYASLTYALIQKLINL